MDIYFNKKVVKYMKKKITIEQPVLRLLNIYISAFFIRNCHTNKKNRMHYNIGKGEIFFLKKIWNCTFFSLPARHILSQKWWNSYK